MKKIQLFKSFTLAALLTLPTIATAEIFWVTGSVTRTVIETDEYGKCMIKLDRDIGNVCTSSWISLDCEGKYHAAGDGDRMLNVAILAQNLNKQISIKVDTTKQFKTYCTAKRIDLL